LRRRDAHLDKQLDSCLVLESPVEGHERTVGWVGFGLFVIAFAYIEILDSYYFVQDDMLVTGFPSILLGLRGIWHGHWPEYNPFCLLGSPLASSGGGSLTYPPMLLAYAIARHALHDEYATLEVFAFLHLGAGYWATFWLGKILRLRPTTAALVALSFILSGSILVMGRGWDYFVAAAVWIPLLTASAVTLTRSLGGWKWALGTGIGLGVCYHVGFPQLWVYEAGFWGLGVAISLATMRRGRARSAAWVVVALFLAMGLIWPLLSVQMSLGEGLTRQSGYGNGIFDGLWGLLAPWPLVLADHPNMWGSSDRQYMTQLFFFGGVLPILALAGLGVLFTARVRRVLTHNYVIAGSAVLAFWLALGREGMLWQVLLEIPFLNKVNNHPFRLLPFVVFFVALFGGMTFDGVMGRLARPARWRWAFYSVAGLLLAWHVGHVGTSFYSYGFDPFPELPSEFSEMASPEGEPSTSGRILPIAPMRSIAPDYGLSLEHSLPGVYRIPSFSGYDPLTEGKPAFQTAMGHLQTNPQEALDEYGVQWILVHRTVFEPVISNRFAKSFERTVRYGNVLHLLPGIGTTFTGNDDSLRIYENTHARPLAFWEDTPQEALPIRLATNGFDVSLSPAEQDKRLVLNFLWYKQLVAEIDGVAVECEQDDWSRTVVDVPAGTQSVALRFEPGWRPGLLVGLLLLCLGGALGLWLQSAFSRRRSPDLAPAGDE